MELKAYRRFGPKLPEVGRSEWMMLEIVATLYRTGVWRGPCPCCGKETEVRLLPDEEEEASHA